MQIARRRGSGFHSHPEGAAGRVRSVANRYRDIGNTRLIGCRRNVHRAVGSGATEHNVVIGDYRHVVRAGGNGEVRSGSLRVTDDKRNRPSRSVRGDNLIGYGRDRGRLIDLADNHVERA